MERAVYYARVSTDEERQVNALVKQVKECEDCIKDKGWRLIEGYVDEGKSGTTTKKRDEYRRLYEDMEGGKFDIIVIKSQDRLQRSAKDWYIFLDRLVSNGLKLYMYIENQFYTPDNALITGIKAILAEEFSRDLSKKLVNANNKRKEAAANGEDFNAQGIYNLLGFTSVKGKIEIVPEEAEIVRLIYSKYIEYASTVKVKDYLNSHGYRTKKGNLFAPATISRCIRNEHNKGTYVLGKKAMDFNQKKVVDMPEDEWVIVPNAHEAIVDPATWQRANDLLKQHSSEVGGRGRGKKVGTDPLSGKMFCAECGGQMWKHKTGKDYYIWSCRYIYDTDTPKDHGRISRNALREGYSKVIEGLKGIDVEISKEYMKKSFKADLEALRATLSEKDDTNRVQKELDELKAKKKRLVDAYTEGILAKEDMATQLDTINEGIERLEKALVPVELSEDIREINRVLANMDEEFDKWVATDDFLEKQIDFLIDHTRRVKVTKDKAVSIEVDLISGWLFAVAGEVLGMVETGGGDEVTPTGGFSGKEFLSFVNSKEAFCLQKNKNDLFKFFVVI